MKSALTSQHSDTIASVSRILASIIVVLAVMVILGWFFDISGLKTLLPDLASMKFNTALLFLISAICIRASEKRIILAISTVVILVSSLTLFQYFAGINIGIDQLFVADNEISNFPGRMSIASASNFSLLGIGLLLRVYQQRFSNFIALLVLLFSLIALIGYLYGSEILYGASIFSTMALHTALSFFVLAIALMLGNEDSQIVTILSDDTAGSTLLRILLPTTVLVLLLVTWLFNLGYQSNLYSIEFNTVLTSVTSIPILIITIYLLAFRLHEVDKHRLSALEELRLNNQQLEASIQERTREVETKNAELLALTRRYDIAEIVGKFGHWERHPKRDTSIWSNGLRHIFGIEEDYTPNFEEYLAFVHEADRERVAETILNGVATKTPYEQEYRIVRPDGEERIVYAVVRFDDVMQEEPDSALPGSIIDITGRKQLEREAKTYQIAIESSSEMMIVLNDNHEYTIANRVYLDYHQLGKEDIIGHHLRDIVGEDIYNSRLLPHLQLCFEGEVQNFQNSMEFPKLGMRNLLINYSPLMDESGDVSHVVIVLRDVTENVLNNSKLREMVENISELNMELEAKTTQFEGILSTAHDAIISINEDEDIILFNTGAERIFGYKSDEIVGKKLSVLLPEDARAVHRVHLKSFAESEQTNRRMASERSEVLGVRKDGTTLVIEASLSRLKVRDTVIFTAVIRDVSQQKRLEKTIRQANEALEQNNKELQQFAYIVSHDMRAPLINLKGFSSLLEKSVRELTVILTRYEDDMSPDDLTAVQKVSSEKLPLALNFIETSVTRLDQYTGAILELSRVGRRDLHPELVDMNTLIENIIQSLHVSISEKNIHVELDNLSEFMTDRFAIDQILTNVITNAVKYMDKEDGAFIRVRGEVVGDEAVFIIEDNGRGISESDADRVFAPFRRAGKNNTEGEGMGLAYVQALVKRLGGDITFSSIIGEGTTFTISLPILEA